MKNQHGKFTGLFAALLGLLAGALTVQGQAYSPSNWVNDPFCANLNFALTGGDSTSPLFTNNGVQRGTLYASSPIGATLALTHPGDSLSCTGQIVLTGDINVDGNMQLRVGLFYRGENTRDTNWLGYMFGNPTGVGGEAKTGLYVRNNPNTGIFSSGSSDSATRPPCTDCTYNAGWGAGTYDFSLVITRLPGNAQSIAWKLAGVAPNIYSYSGTYTNQVATTVPPAFDQVGILGGAALFSSASSSASIGIRGLVVTLTKQNDAP